jgi:2'-5' RNA ligase
MVAMVQSVELLLDPGLDRAVREQWRALADAGVGSLATHTSPSNRPHITVLAASAVPDPVGALLPEAVAGLPVDLRLGGIVLFGGGTRRVLARLVVPSPRLLEMHRRVLEVAGSLPGMSATSTVGRWTPHVTLARRLPVADLPRALAVLPDRGEIDGAATGVRRWDGDRRHEWPLAPAPACPMSPEDHR